MARRNKILISVGDKFESKSSGEFQVIGALPKNGRRGMYKIRFKETGFEVEVSKTAIVQGMIKDPYSASVYGVGYIGFGKYKTKVEGKETSAYSTWRSMILRSYSSRFHKTNPSYSKCVVEPCWHNFQVFAEWFEVNFKEGMQLDKDLLCSLYSIYPTRYGPDTCCFLPKEINSAIAQPIVDKNGIPSGVVTDRGKYVSGYGSSRKMRFCTANEAIEYQIGTRRKVCSGRLDKYRDVLTPEVRVALGFLWDKDISFYEKYLETS